MHYIVVDFEWNQPISFNSSAYLKVKDKLLFEIIQIGAIKLDENFNIIDSFNSIIKPTHFKKIHPRIKRMTKISNEQLLEAPDFMQANEKFTSFCGSDAKLLTWGSEDVSVYKQNVDCFNIDNSSFPFYNLQSLYSHEEELGKQQKGLKAAMEKYNIDEDDELPFHNAANDAYYTARVFQNVKNRQSILKYPLQARKLQHNSKLKGIHTNYQVLSINGGLQYDCVANPVCPACKSPCKFVYQLVPQSPSRYISLLKCQTHGQIYMQVRFVRLSNKNIGMAISLNPVSDNEKAYIKAKIHQNKLYPELNKYSTDIGCLDYNLQGNMPFED